MSVILPFKTDRTRRGSAQTLRSRQSQAELIPLDPSSRIRRTLRSSGPQTALQLSRKTGCRTAQIWDLAMQAAASRELSYDPQTQYFALPQS